MDEYVEIFDAYLAAGRIDKAYYLAMSLSDIFLRRDKARYRGELFRNFFGKMMHEHLIQYQATDFEICDYQVFSLGGTARLFRGPCPSHVELLQGNYVTIFGAAQLFGRFHEKPFGVMLKESHGLATLNLARGGAGPEFFLNPNYLRLANRGRAVVLQVLSGRSVGCDEYPGTRMTARAGSGDAPVERIDLLKSIWAKDRQEAIRLVGKWQSSYVRLMQQLIGKIRVPVYLVWMSRRPLSGWSAERLAREPEFGSFPQLVDEKMVRQLANSGVAGFIDLAPDKNPRFALKSRIDGQPCPFFLPGGQEVWENSYYPSILPHEELHQRLAGTLAGLSPGGRD